jgi:hypothetical protein
MRHRWARLALALPAAIILYGVAHAASLSDKDVQLMVRAIGFLRPEPDNSGIVAIAYDAADPDSKRDAEAIASYFAGGLKAGPAVLLPRVLDGPRLAGGGFAAIITASGANLDLVAAAARQWHAPCLTGDASLVRSGRCVLSVRSEPKVEITVSRTAAADVGVSFVSAFLMMVTQF